jgi:hypothetical protein
MSIGSLVLALLVTASSPAVAQPPSPIHVHGQWLTRSFAIYHLSLSVPSDWNVGESWTMFGSFEDLMGSFSNQLLSPPCTTSGNSTECGPPLTSLEPGAMLVDVYHNGSPLWTISSQPGTPMTVSGMPARVTVEAGSQGACYGLGADRTRDEVIVMPASSDNYFEIAICSRGVPDAVGARVMASVRLT